MTDHQCKPGATVYYCPASGETESDCHGGFDVCCDRPDLHRPVSTVLRDHLAAALIARIKQATVSQAQPYGAVASLFAATEFDLADTALAALTEHLDIGEAEAWCKTCRRVWEGKRHRCESDTEQRLAQAEAVLAGVTALYEQWAKAGPPPLGTLIAREWDKRLVELRAALNPPEASP